MLFHSGTRGHQPDYGSGGRQRGRRSPGSGNGPGVHGEDASDFPPVSGFGEPVPPHYQENQDDYAAGICGRDCAPGFQVRGKRASRGHPHLYSGGCGKGTGAPGSIPKTVKPSRFLQGVRGGGCFGAGGGGDCQSQKAGGAGGTFRCPGEGIGGADGICRSAENSRGEHHDGQGNDFLEKSLFHVDGGNSPGGLHQPDSGAGGPGDCRGIRHCGAGPGEMELGRKPEDSSH